MFEDMKEITEKHLKIAKKLKRRKGRCWVSCKECPFDESNSKSSLGCIRNNYIDYVLFSCDKDKKLVKNCKKFIKFAKEKLGV